MPMLYQIPSNVEKANITMGYPIKFTPLSSFVQMLLDNWRSAKTSKNTSAFYHKYVFGLIEHSILQPFLNEEDYKVFKGKMQKTNRVYIGPKIIQEHFQNSVFTSIFSSTPPDGNAILEKLLEIFNLLKSKLEREIEKLETQILMEYLYHFTISINSLLQRFKQYDVTLPLTGIKNLIQQEINKQSIDFFGEPLSGLQIMGVLETRAIDFEHVILTSVNEGIMPKGKFQNSFIPYEIARKFGLPGYKEQDAIYAYYFYRLLQRSKKIDLLYHNSKDNLNSSGEESRFILQILKAFEGQTQIKINKYHFASKATKENSETKILKSDLVLKKIKDYLGHKVSPSAINTFLNCPLDFYNLYILGLREEDELEEEVDASTFGTIVHNVLEELLKTYINKSITGKDITSFKDKYKALLDEQFINQFGEIDNVQTGANRLHYEAARNFIEAYIKFEFVNAEKFKTEIINLEEVLEHKISLTLHGEETVINLFGKADRIASIDGIVQILDYKTGSVEPNDLKLDVKKIFEDGNKIKGKALQILIYAYLYLKRYPETNDIQAHIYSFKNKSHGFQPLIIDGKVADKTSILELTPRLLTHIFEDLLNTETLIEHNPKSLYCTYCSN
jgi:CRISPR/Cas system-associated exonuclease Cas4 (RecB family)